MQRVYIYPQDISSGQISVSDKNQLHHLKDVLRLKVDDALVAFDNQGNEYSCLIRAVSKDKIILKITAKKNMIAPNSKLTIACAIPKKAKMDEIIDKLTQLGVERIIPMITRRVIVKLDKKKQALRLERWRKIARGASEQSQRSTLPMVDEIKTIKEVLSGADNFNLKLIPTLEGKRRSLKEVLGRQKFSNLLILIGPEGDFSEEEVSLANKHGFIPVCLGDTVLRVDTAAIAVASYIKLNENH